MADDQARAIAFLNEHFSPWTFSGDEPVTQALIALIAAVRAEQTREPREIDRQAIADMNKMLADASAEMERLNAILDKV